MGNISDSERKTTSGLIWRLSYTHPESKCRTFGRKKWVHGRGKKKSRV